MRPRRSIIAEAKADRAESKYKGVLFLRDIPETTKIAFKAACVSRNRTMRDIHVILMRKFAEAVRTGKPSINIRELFVERE